MQFCSGKSEHDIKEILNPASDSGWQNYRKLTFMTRNHDKGKHEKKNMS